MRGRWNKPQIRHCRQCDTEFQTFGNNKLHCSLPCRLKSEATHFPNKNECWIWRKSKNPVTGYGQLASWENGKRKLYAAHRLSFSTFVAPIPDGLQVLHKCDNRACFNPAHLFLGTQQDNMDDMIVKGRQRHVTAVVHWTKLHPEKIPRGAEHYSQKRAASMRRGETHHYAKITNLQAAEIRASQETLRFLSEKYGLSQSSLSRIKRGKAYKS